MNGPRTRPGCTADAETIERFGEEWNAFDETAEDPGERVRAFEAYFSLFPFAELSNAEGFDPGCGSGRWAALVAQRVGHLHCLDSAEKALAVARSNPAGLPNVTFHLASSDDIPVADGSLDFGYALGVLQHTADPEAAMANCVAKLKPGAPFLLYV